MSDFDISKCESELPSLLQIITSQYSDEEAKNIMLLGSLVSLSSVLPNYTGSYGGEEIYPNLYSFFIGNAATGKGKLIKCSKIVSLVDKYLKDKDSGLLIPGNITYPGFMQLLNAYGGNGLIIETESDCISDSFAKEHGNYSELLRKAFHHENVSSYRKGEKEFIGIDNPKLSILISGTPEQVPRLFKNGEDGLFSRFMFYQLKLNPGWDNSILSKSPFDESSLNKIQLSLLEMFKYMTS
ncbi:DUF3987 domain-containing protein [Roseivirga sp.]|uniref:DUF3987 domain-containing protein n=1 Tax=Roseivirga sp. TaxID=1964215 RepID=UPI003B8E79ED